MLTRKQHDLLWYIDQFTRENDGISPSFDEMRAFLGARSKSGVHRLVNALEERGFITRLPHRARTLKALRVPEKRITSPSYEQLAIILGVAP
jgi:repressor LexA